ncbi:nitrogen fixation protein NifX [Telmatospirillum sp. J64-1]|uniref:nitrogen fixation protein NifX n=1 Tax=Telmatospirillum sp. J64-1 TaxID=2502183 RepID=UPI00115D6914|nr:nitrogen fixation protein NifX [Telmatospirillum sp. J64-1]
MRIAFATGDMKTVDAHFGSARKMAIYDVSVDEATFIEAIAFDEVSSQDGVHAEDGDDRLGAKIEALQGCAMLFVLAIGGPAAARVVNSRIHPVKLPRPESIEAVIARLQGQMAGTPPPWMRKILMADRKDMDFLEEEEAL